MSRGFCAPKTSTRWSAFVAVLAVFISTLIFIDVPHAAEAAVSKANLVLSYDVTNASSYPGTGSSITDLSGGGHTATLSNSSVTSSAMTFNGGSNGSSFATISGDINGFNNGLTVTFEGSLGAADSFERIISVGDTAVNANGLWNNGGDGFWVGRYWTSTEIAIEYFNNGVSGGQCRTSGASADATVARWTLTVSSTGLCRIFKNNIELQTNNDGGANSASGTQMRVQPSAATGQTYNYLGRSHWTGDPDLSGSIRWIKVYKAGFSTTEVADEYTGSVTFDANGGTGTQGAQSATAASTLSSNQFSRNGYTFTGWNTAANGAGTAYANASTYSFSDDITLYAQWSLNAPTVSVATSVSGTAKVGQTLTATAATYVSGTTPTVVSQWQSSSDNSTWSDISGATSLTYALTASDAGNFFRFKQSITNAVGSITSTSAATSMVLSTNTVAGASGSSSDVGSMFTVPSGSTVYNVTLTSSNLSGLFQLGTTTGLTWVEGYSTTASYMPTSITGTGSIFSFRGTGDAINAALATLTYTSSTVQTDVLKINYAVGSATASDKSNYIPIFDNGKLTYHYYVYIQSTGSAVQSAAASTLAGYGSTVGGITSSNGWYLVTPRYAVENSRALAMISADPNVWTSGVATSAPTWTWPSGTDGYSSAVTYSYGGTAQNGMFTYWGTGQPNVASGTGYMGYWQLAWGTGVSTNSYATSILAETYSATPLSATTTAQTYRTVIAPDSPTGLTATPASKTSVTLNWAAPASAGTDAITDYKIQYSTDQSTWTTWSHSTSTSTSATITGLTAGNNYWYRVAAVSSVTGAYSTAVSNMQADPATQVNLTGYSIPATTAGTVRVLLYTSNAAGNLSVTSVSGLTGIRNTSNYSTSTGNAALLQQGRMIGFVGSAANINSALATLRYSAALASTDIISMYVSTGGEYIPIVRSNALTFHYYGYSGSTYSSQSVASSSIAAQTINGVSVSSAFLATPATLAEQQFHTDNISTYAGDSIWLGGTTNGTNWNWLSNTDLASIVFSPGSNSSSYTNSTTGDVFPLRWNSGEPNGGVATGNCMVLYGNASSARTTWDDQPCSTTNRNAAWEYSNSTPLGLNNNAPASANYTPATSSRTVTVVAPAAAPTGLTATSSIAGQVDLSWTAPAGVSGITSYSVQYSADGSTWTEARSSVSTAVTQAITGLINGTYYQFRVAAIISNGIGNYASVYFTPNGAARVNGLTSAESAISSFQIDGNLASKYVRVVIRSSASGSSLRLGTYAGLTGIRGTANYTTTVGASALGTSGQMLGLVGTGAQVNAALANLKYTGPAAPTTDSISLWVSAGTTGAPPQEFVPVVNARGQVDFHYFGYTSTSLTWQQAANAALSNATTINGQSATNKYLATAESADQNGMVSSVAGSNGFWLSAADYTAVNSSNPDGDWYWMGPDTGVSLFYRGGTSAGTGGIQNSSFVAWASTSSAQGEPNGTTGENCMSNSGNAYALTNSGYTAVANVGGVSWNDNSCTATTGYVWEYMTNEPVGASSVGDNYAGMTALAINVNPNATAPTSVAATATGTTSAVVTWTAPTVYNTSALTDYKLEWSTSSTFASVLGTDAVTSTYAAQTVTGLSPNTQYYFRVTATGSGWTGLTSTIVTATTKSSATTLTVVATGGGTAGTDFTTANGMIASVSANSVSINAADLQTALSANGNVKLLADTVVISSAVTSSATSLLSLGNSSASRVSINADLTLSGSTAGLVIMPGACAYSSAATYSSCYSIDVKTGANVTLLGATPTLSIGGTSYTVVNTVSGLTTFAGTSSNYSLPWAMTASLDLSGTTYTNSIFKAGYFTGTFDGLGNTASNISITSNSSSNWEIGFFYVLSNATVRNFGVTNINYLANPTAGANYSSMGGIGAYNSGTNNIDQVWSTGTLKVSSTSVPLAVGGILGWIPSGSTTLTRSWSSVNIDTAAASGNIVEAVGGIVAGTVSSLGQPSSSAGSNLTVNEAYFTGAINFSTYGWRGIGGILGIHYDTGTTRLTDVFNWGFIQTDSNSAGITGVIENGTATITRAYTSSAVCNANGAFAGCTVSQKPGATLSGTTAEAWGSTTGTNLVNLATPLLSLFVKPYLRTGNAGFTDGSYGAVGYKLYDANNNENTTITGATGYPSVTGSAVWDTISASTAVGTYSVKYSSGLSLTGTAASSYSLNAAAAATSIQLTSTTISSAPTSVSLTGSGQTTAVVGWTAPSTLGAGGVTNYRVWYSTNSTLSGASYIHTSSSRTWVFLSGLTSNTTYYVKVQALGSAWVSDLSSSANGSTKSAATSLTVVSSGGGVAGTNFTNSGGAFTPVGSNTTASINASDIQTALEAGSSILAADTVTISAAMSWSASTKLTLANAAGSSVAINADVTALGASAGLEIASSTYSLDTKNGVNVVLSGATSTFSLGGNPFTLIRSVADLSNAQATWWYALANPITFSASLSSSPVNLAYAGIFDGLGNTVNNMTISPTTTGDYGFFRSLAGATVRNMGFTNVNISTSTASLNLRLGAIAGNGSSAGTNNLSQVWATGFINQTASTGAVEAGGLFGGATAGSLNITKAWSSVAVSTYAPSVGSGGIIGTNVSTFSGGPGAGNTLVISESYSTGNIYRNLASTVWYGNAGIIGVAYGAGQTLTNVFSWGNINSVGVSAGISTAGISGVGSATITNAYTTHPSCGGTATNCLAGQTAGAAVTGFSSGLWSTVNGASLVNLPLPTKTLYVQVTAPTDGSYGTMGYQIVDSTGSVQSASALTGLNLSVTGTPSYTINSTATKATYNVNYVTGLILAGTSSGVYSLSAWINTTSVTISKYNQTVTWSPTTSVAFAGGTLTPSAAPASTITTTFSYQVSSQGTTGCTVNSSTGVLSYTAAGTCAVTVTGAATTDYVTGSATVSFVIGSPTSSITIVSTGGGVQGTDYTLANGAMYAAAGSSISINTADLSSALSSGSVTLAASTVTINAAVSWSSNSILTLGVSTASTVNINSKLEATGASAGVIIASSSYGLDVKNGASVVLSGASSTLSVGGTAYSLIRSTSDFSSITSASSQRWALAKPISFSGTRTTSPVNLSFTGTFDGLGNTVNALTFSGAAGDAYLALFKQLNGASIRNLGITNLSHVASSAGTSGEYGFGALAGAVQTGTTTVSQVWSTGLIQLTATTAYRGVAAGGLVGLSNGGGTLDLSRSWSSVSLNASAATISYMTLGGLVGGDYNAFGQDNTAGGGSIILTEVYATGPISAPTLSWWGIGGLIGLHWASGNTIRMTDAFSWSSVTAGVSVWGGVFGQSGGSTPSLTRTYTSRPYCWYNTTTATGCTPNVTPGTSSGLSGSAWTGGVSLATVAAPTIPLFVKPKFSNSTASVLDVGYDIVDGLGNVVTLSSLNLTVTGTAAFTPSSLPASATYSLFYDSGLTLGGTNVGLYTLSAWPTALSVTITRDVSTMTWSPTTSFIRTDSGTTLAAPTSNSSATPSYSVSGTGNSASCSITSARVLTFTATGSCTVTATYPQNSAYTAVSQSVTITVTDAPPASPTSLSVTAGAASGQLGVSWTAPSTTNTGGSIASYTLETSTDNSTWTVAQTGIATTSTTLTGLTNGSALYVRVKAVNTASVAGTYVTSAATSPYWKPINSVLPSFTGSAVGGLQLTGSVGTWSDNGSSVTSTVYQWQLSTDSGTNYTDISGATSSNYTLLASQAGNLVRLKVTKTNSAGSTIAYSTATSAIQSGLASAPTLGAITRGNTQLTVNWTAPSTTNGGTISAYKVQYSTDATTWSTASSAVADTATSYVITGLTNGTGYYVRVMAITAAGDGSAATSSGTTIPATGPSNTGIPTVSGTVAVARALTSTNGSWADGGDSTTYTYQWQSSATGLGTWSDIAGATSSSYTPVTADVGTYLRLTVTATNTVSSASASTSSTTVVLSGLAAAPTAIYTLARNQQLNFNWTAPSLLNGGVISDYIVEYKKSTDSTWTTVNVGSATNFLQINGLTNGVAYDGRVTAVTAAGSGPSGSLTSGVGSTPYSYPLATAVPTTGTPAVAVAVAATTGSWNENGRAITSYTYQWETSANGSTGWTAISGATSSNYTPVSGDAGNYLRVKVVATNLGGSSPASYSAATTAVKSGLATAATLGSTTRGNTQLTVNWSAPSSTNGGTISAYKVAYSTDRSTWTTASSTVSASATSYTITGLTNGTAYYVQVIPITAAGDGVAAASTGTTTPATGPSNSVAPTISGTAAAARLMSSTNGTWADGGDAITYSYQWQSSADGSTNWTDISGATSSTYTAAANQVGSYLRLNVTATNTVSALTVASSSSTIVQSGLAGAASALSSTASNGQLVLSWTAPANVNGGVISDYTVEYKASTDSSWTSTTVGSTASTKTITGLTNAVAYDWRVTAVTAAGSGTTASFTAATSSTPFTTPSNTSLPTTPSMVGGVTGTATAGSWNGNGRNISSYAYQWEKSTDGGTSWSAVSGATALTYTPASTDAGALFRIKVTATNAAGSVSAWSAASAATQSGIAGATRNIVLTNAGSQQVTVSWSAPATTNGGTILKYWIYASSDGVNWPRSDSTANGSTMSITLPGFTNGTSYYIAVVAETAAGITYAPTPTTFPRITVFGSPTVTNSGSLSTNSPVGGYAVTLNDPSWNDQGSSITAYTYQWQLSADGSTGWTAISGATSSSYTPLAVDAGKYLRVVSSATNSGGTTTSNIQATSAMRSGKASAPLSLNLTRSGSGSLTASWSAPSTLNGGTHQTYALWTSADNGTSWVSAGTTTNTSVTVTGLTNGTSYLVKVLSRSTGGIDGDPVQSATALSAGAAPSNSVVPSFTGTVAAGRILTGADGTWAENGFTATYTYQWQSSVDGSTSWTNVLGATSASYTVTNSYAGKYLRLAVTATNSLGSTTAYSVATTAVATGLTTAPTAVTATRADAGLSVSWTAPATLNGGVISGYTVKYSTDNFSWSTASSTVAAGATSYSITGLTNGTPYYVQVFAETAAGLSPAGSISGTATPSTTATNTVLPAITGTVAVTRQLSVSDGTWTTGGASVAYSYQWQNSANGSTGWANISGATSATYTPDAAQAGKYLRAVVTATNAAGAVSANTSATTVVQTGLADAPASVSAAFSDSNGLHINVSWTDPASINGASGISAYVLSYSTTANGTYTVVSSSLPGNSSTYAITGLTQGQTYFFRVSATTAAGAGASLTTSSSTLFGGPPTISTSPAITGTQAVGYALTTDDGVWNTNGLAISGYSYQWQISSDNSSWSNIAGATSSSYTPVTADAGNYLRTVVSATNSVGTTAAQSSGTLIGTGIADAPATVSVTPGDNQLAVTWAAVTGSALHSAVRGGYSVQWSTDGTTWASATTASSATSFTITGVTNAIAYQVRVAAVAATTSAVGTAKVATGTYVPFGAPINNTAPVLSGSQARGYQLTATDGVWFDNGRSITATSYQWQRSTDGGASWTNIALATASSYTLSSTDTGNKVRLQVTTTNVAGSSTVSSSASSTIESAVADAPTNLSVTAGDRQLDVQWVAPTTLNGGTIANYRVEYSSNNGTSWTTVSRAASTTTTQNISGLTNATAYLVRVSALTTVVGTSQTIGAAVVPYSNPINTALPTVTPSPRLLDTLSATAGTWDSNGSDYVFTGYQWQVSNDAGSTWQDIAGETSLTYVSQNELGKPLRLKVTRTNGGGATIAYSAASSPVVIGTPGAPTALATAPGDLSLTATWTAPTVLAGGSITDYTVQYSSNGGTSWTTVSRSASVTTSQAITGLTQGLTYLVRVRSETGESSAWSATASFTAVGKPSNTVAPSISGTPLVGQTLSAAPGTWNNNGSGLTGYAYEWQQSTDGGTNWNSVLGGTNPTLPAVSGRIYRVKVTATNAAGSTSTTSAATAAVASARATAPGSLSVLDQDQQVTVSWQTPIGLGGVPLVDYEVDYSADGGNTWQAVSRTPSTTTTQVITGLTNGVDYDVRVRAITTVTGQYAISSNSTRPHGAPINAGSVALISGQAKFGQNLSTSNGSWNWNGSSQNTFSYQWMHSSDNGQSWSAIAGATASSYTVGEYVGQKIRVDLTATNAHGESTTISSTATTAVLPANSSGPRSLAITPSDQSVSLSWAVPSNLGGTSITAYEIEVSTDSSTWFPAATATPSATSATVSSLTNGVPYYFRVHAVTAVSGAWSYFDVKTPFGVPLVQNVPTVSGTLVFGQTLNATTGDWYENGDNITALEYQWQFNDGSTWQNILGATAYGYTVGNYVGRTLRVTVTATNSAGRTTATSAATTTVIAAPTNGVTNLTVTPADQSLAVSWTAPSYLGGAAITDYLVDYSTNGGSTWTPVAHTASASTSRTITGLTNGTSYAIRVRAVNGVTGAATVDASGTVPRGLPINTGLPALSGTAQNNQMMSATAGTWGANGSSISSTTYQWQVFDGSTWSNISGATNSLYTVSGNVGRTLRAVVTVTNAAGQSTAASTASATVLPAGASAPRILTATEGDQQVQLNWISPATTGGANVIDYEIQTSADGNMWSPVSRTASTTTSQLLTGLTNGDALYARVRALNGVNGSWAFLSTPATPRGLPIVITVPVVSGVEAFGSTLTTTDGDWNVNGAAISSTTYQWQSSLNGTTWTNIIGATQQNYTIGLFVNSRLRVKVTQTNAAGSTVEYSQPTGVIAASTPAAPSITTQQSGNASIGVVWSDPTHTGGVANTGYTVEYSTDQVNWTSQNVGPTVHSMAVDNLVNGTSYYVRVRAVTTLHGLWSNTAGPLTPVAPVIPVTPVFSPSPSPSATTSPADLIRQVVMPVSLAPSSTLRTSTGSQITVTTDGRIELAPSQSIALLNGAPVAASVVEQGQNLMVKTESVNLQVTFENAAGQTSHDDQLSMTGTGFAPNSPVAAWIQSTPRKVADVTAGPDGATNLDFVIPSDLSLGHHTLQINGVSSNGQILSVAYGIEIVAEDATPTQPSGWSYVGWIALIALIVAAIILALVALQRRRRQLQND